MKEGAILILKTGEALSPVRRSRGDFEDWIARGLGLAVDALEVVSAHRGEALPAAQDLRGVVVTGSPAMVSERADWSEDAARWLAAIVEADALPVLGICYGHQLIAHGLGGEVGPNPRGREMGTVDVRFDAGHDEDGGGAPSAGRKGPSGRPSHAVGAIEPLFRGSTTFPAHMSHVESVLRPPDGARVLATTALDPHSVLAFGPRQWGVQFHPEFDREIMQGYIEARRDILADEGIDPDRLIAGARDADASGRVLARFAVLADSGSD